MVDPILIGLGLLALAGSDETTIPNVPANLGKLKRLAGEAGMSADWITFLAAVAHHESTWHASAHNDSTKEVAASGKAYDRNANTLRACPFSRSAYVIGSGGWYGFLPANGIVSAFRGTSAVCIDPRSVFDPWASTLMAIAYANNLRTRWKSFRESDGTWLALNRGWKRPSKMNIPNQKTDDRFRRGLRAQGVSESFAGRRVTPIPDGWRASRLLDAATA